MAWNDGKFELNGIDWYIAKNVCDTIGVQNTTMAMRTVKDQYKQKIPLNNETALQWIINNQGVIQLLRKSRKVIAKSILEYELSVEAKPNVRQRDGTKGVYRLIQDCRKLVVEGDDNVGINVLPMLQLYLLKVSENDAQKAITAYYKWVHILVQSGNIKNLSLTVRKYMRSKKKQQKMSLVWLQDFINLGYLNNSDIMTAEDAVLELLETEFQEVCDLRFGHKKVFWLGNEPYMFFSKSKLIKWFDGILKHKPFMESARKRFISPKNVMQSIIESVEWCKVNKHMLVK